VSWIQDPRQPVRFPSAASWQPSKKRDPLEDVRRAMEDIHLRAPVIGEDPTARLLVAVPNDEQGNGFLESLREEQEALGFHFAGTLGEILRRLHVERAELADDMRDRFAFLDILPGCQFAVMNGILRYGCAAKSANDPFPDIDVEPDQRMRHSGTALGSNFQLRSSGSKHDDYLKVLNTSAAPSTGKGVVIAVIDSGYEKARVLDGFFDLVEPTNKSEKDNYGHGTAMASIIKDIATGAKIYAVRMSDQDPDVSEAMLGISAGSFHYAADILNLSFGLPEGTVCLQCGAQPAVSRVLKRFLQSLAEKAVSTNGKPVLVAATGNDGRSTGFDSPARWDFALAVGSITEALDRSAFSNYGTKLHARYIMMPGGEEQQGAASEWVGEATHKCFGTSVAAAYASALLALYMSDSKYQNADRAAFLKDVLQQCQACHNHKTVEHGEGYLRYKPRR
jgi:subtilisin family serine protease